MATTNGKRTMRMSNLSELLREVEVKYFLAASKSVLTGWVKVYELYDESGMTANAFAQLVVDAEIEGRVSTVKQNISHIEWAVENGYELGEFVSLGEIRALRYPAKPQAAKAVKRFDAKREAKKYTVKQLEAMLAVAKAGK